MEKIKTEKSWVSKTMLRRMSIVWFLLILIGILFYKSTVVAIISGILSTLTLFMILFFSYAYYKLSAEGGDLQNRISALVTNKINEKSSGQLLDIGCGSGILSVDLALKCPELKIQAIDYWGSMWGYSKEKCEKLAKDHHVSDRIHFERASASSLPFKDKTFDIIISNMVFHEVADAKDKREVIKEALRVLKKGGQFVFQDLLLSEKLYGKPDELVQFVKDSGVESISLERTSNLVNIPGLLKGPVFFGYAAILSGIK